MRSEFSKHRRSRLRRGASGIEFSPRSRGRPGRSRRLRTSRLLLLIAAVLALVLCAEAALAIFTSYRFALRKVRVEGASEFTLPLVLQQAPSPGPNLFALPGRRIADRLRALSFVEEVSLKKRPPGTLLIQLKERRPIAFFNQNGNAVFLDGSGVAFARPGPLPAGIPEVQGIEANPRALGRPIPGMKAFALREGLCALAQNTNLKVKTLVVDEHGCLAAHLVTGTQLRLGPPEELERKLLLVKAAIASLGPSRPAEYFDVSVPEAPIWKPL